MLRLLCLLPEFLQHSKARLSAPYPRPQVVNISERFVSSFLNLGTFTNILVRKFCSILIEAARACLNRSAIVRV